MQTEFDNLTASRIVCTTLVATTTVKWCTKSWVSNHTGGTRGLECPIILDKQGIPFLKLKLYELCRAKPWLPMAGVALTAKWRQHLQKMFTFWEKSLGGGTLQSWHVLLNLASHCTAIVQQPNYNSVFQSTFNMRCALDVVPEVWPAPDVEPVHLLAMDYAYIQKVMGRGVSVLSLPSPFVQAKMENASAVSAAYSACMRCLQLIYDM